MPLEEACRADNPRVYLDIEIDGEAAGRVEIELTLTLTTDPDPTLSLSLSRWLPQGESRAARGGVSRR